MDKSLSLRELKPQDKDNFYAYLETENLFKFDLYQADDLKHEDSFDHVLQYSHEHTFLCLIDQNGKLNGWIYTIPYKDETKEGVLLTLSINPKYANSDYVLKSIENFLNILKDQGNKHVYSLIHPFNDSSTRFAVLLGAEQIGERVIRGTTFLLFELSLET